MRTGMKGGGTNQNYQKRYNRALTLNAIRTAGCISRVEISRRIGLEKSTVTNIVGELLRAGLVREGGRADAGIAGGRKPILLEIEGEYGYLLGIELQPHGYQAVLMDLLGRVVRSFGGRPSQETGRQTSGRAPDDAQPEAWSQATAERSFTALLTGVTDAVLDRLEREGYRPAAIAFGIPGRIDRRRGVILHSKPHHLHTYEISKQLWKRYRRPVFVENDANCGAWGEIQPRAGAAGSTGAAEAGESAAAPPSFVFLLTELRGAVPLISIGLGIVIEGHVFSGSSFTAGEYRSCHWSSRRGTESSFEHPGADRITSDRAVKQKFLRDLIRSLSTITAAVDPAFLICGGHTEFYFEEMKALLQTEMQHTHLGLVDSTGDFVQLSKYGENAVPLGAAAMVLEHLYKGPQFISEHQYMQIDWQSLLNRAEPT